MTSLKWIVVTAISIVVVVAGTMVYYDNLPVLDETLDQQDERNGNSIDAVVPESTDSAIVAPSPYVKEFQLARDIFPNGILVDRNGIVWTVGSKSGSLIAFDPKQQTVKSYAIPDSEGSGLVMVWAMVEDDERILFSGSSKIPLWRFDPQTEGFEPIMSPGGSPIQMKSDADGRIWYTSLSNGIVGVLHKEGEEYVAKEIELGKEAFPSGVYVQNNTIWITKSVVGKIALLETHSDNKRVVDIVNKAQFPEGETLFSPSDIIINDGSAWITEHGTSFLTEYNFESQELRRYPTTLHPTNISTLPYWLEEDLHESGVWFNEHRGNRIAFFDFSTRTLTEYEVPTRNPQSGNIANVLTIAADPTNENILWFTEFTEDKIGFVDRSVPIPFDIRILDRQIIVEENQSAKIDVEITRNRNVELFNNTLSFSASSSAATSGVLLNATAHLSPNTVDLSSIDTIQTVTLELRNEGMQKGQHMLAIGVTDGAVIRTDYLGLVVK